MFLKKRIELNIRANLISMSVLTLLMSLLVVGLLLSLCFWQYQRGRAKQAVIQAFQQNNVLAYKGQHAVRDHQRIILKGHYLPVVQFLLDNQFHQHQFGYHVLSPFQEDNGDVILIDRGFVPGDRRRQQLPTIQTPKIPLTLQGRVHFIHKNRFISQHVVDNPGQSPVVIEQVDFDRIAALLDKQLAAWILWLDADQAHGYHREWHVVTMLPSRHFAYAVQWFLLAMAFVIAIIVANTRKNEHD